ncbi:peptidase M48 [Amycolatopsis antarctica]|uniref:Peptidase M48 n=1 Tax=Amycolatopsis antarctica TaxID=1854586 RepID=A0A263CX05_9PSEU|nr:M56 family metallopeptidase [Amycolatopsis antarctica]OZM70674.1 peptidase M48 [Amycolatopsis antarctica]
MILAAALLLGALLTGCGAPVLLRRLTASRVDPAVAIALWLVTMTGVLLGAVASLTLLVWPGHGPADAITAWVHRCWTALSHDGIPHLDPLVATASTGVALAVAVRMARAGVRRGRRKAALRRQHDQALLLTQPDTTGAAPTLWLDHDTPLAYSLHGHGGLVVATRGLTEQLTKPQVQAVLAHERAHLRGRHHQLVGIVDLAAKALRILPLMRHAAGAIRVLVELAADRAAVAACGAAPVREAVRALTSPLAPTRALAMSGADTAVRLRRLDRPRASRRSAFAVAGAGAGALLIPLTLTTGLLAAAGVLLCA